MSILEKIEILRPKASPVPLIRIGGSQDGAYLLPDDLIGIKACFSPGVNNRKDFEDELLDHYGIVSHMCDYSSDIEKLKTPLKPGQTFKKKWLDVNGGADSISLAEWVHELAPCVEDDLILQIDIEGAEYRNLLGTDDSILRRFRIIVIELHGLRVCNHVNDFNKELGPLLDKLDKYFICVHAHPNNCCGEFLLPGSKLNLPGVHELTFLRRDRWNGTSEKDCYPPMIPHPLDIAFSTPLAPPIFLNEHWLPAGRRTVESTIKQLNDQIEYLQRALANANRQRNDLTNDLHRIAQSIASNFPASGSRPSREELADVAADKIFSLSSYHRASPKNDRVTERSPFFFHTEEGRYEWITIDLGKEFKLYELHIVNRTDYCRDRACFLYCCLHLSQEFDPNQGLPVVVNDGFFNMPGEVSKTDLRGKVARYVTIFSPAKTMLHLSAVKVFGCD